MNTREHVINLLLQLNDQKDLLIAQLQAKNAELEKAAAAQAAALSEEPAKS